MTQVISDVAVTSRLRQITEMAEIRDSSGELIGFFTPASSEKAAMYARAAKLIDPKELERRRALIGSGRSTKEVFEHLLSITQDVKDREILQRKIEILKERDGCATT